MLLQYAAFDSVQISGNLSNLRTGFTSILSWLNCQHCPGIIRMRHSLHSCPIPSPTTTYTHRRSGENCTTGENSTRSDSEVINELSHNGGLKYPLPYSSRHSSWLLARWSTRQSTSLEKWVNICVPAHYVHYPLRPSQKLYEALELDSNSRMDIFYPISSRPRHVEPGQMGEVVPRSSESSTAMFYI